MPPTPLASVADLEGRLGRTFTVEESARATLLLADASAAVRAYTGQQFTAATNQTVRLKSRAGTVRLPQRPITAVDTIENVDGDALEFTWDAGNTVSISGYPLNAWVDVTYDYGYAEIPADIVAVVCQMAGRAMGTPADEAGYASESIGTYSYSVGAAAAAGGVGMLADERAVLDRYRIVGGMARIGP
jgi:hypothetical protein